MHDINEDAVFHCTPRWIVTSADDVHKHLQLCWNRACLCTNQVILSRFYSLLWSCVCIV